MFEYLHFQPDICTLSIEQNTKNVNFIPSGGVAIFIERLFEHSAFNEYKSRILLPNPEWLSDLDVMRAQTMIDTVWHLTSHSERLITPRLPRKNHYYLGFTSIERTNCVKHYEAFAHTPGKSKTRHTQEIINIWVKNTNLRGCPKFCVNGQLAGNCRIDRRHHEQQETRCT